MQENVTGREGVSGSVEKQGTLNVLAKRTEVAAKYSVMIALVFKVECHETWKKRNRLSP